MNTKVDQYVLPPGVGVTPTSSNPLERHDRRDTNFPQIIQVAVLPFYRDGDGVFHYYFVKPVTSRPDDPPRFQIAKGGRDLTEDGVSFADRKEVSGERKRLTDYEPLLRTGLREAEEELGQRLDLIESAYDMGSYSFYSQTKGTEEPGWVFCFEMENPEKLENSEQVFNKPTDPKTAECKWLTLAEFKQEGRQDHAPVLEEVEQRLMVLKKFRRESGEVRTR